MQYFIIFSAIVVLFNLLTSCILDANKPNDSDNYMTSHRVDSAKIDSLFETGTLVTRKEIVNGNTQFALDLFQQLRLNDKNLIFSPYSISTAMAMVYGGAQKETMEQMQAVFHFPSANTQAFHKAMNAVNGQIQSNTQEVMTLKTANKIWQSYQFSAKEGYLEMLKAFYKSPIGMYKNAKEGAEAINNWASKKTNNKINKLLSSKNLEQVDMVLANAIYFYGNWAEQFKAEDTQLDSFFTKDNVEIVPFMNGKIHTAIGEFENYQVAELFYKDNRASMLIVLPRKEFTLQEIVAQLSTKEYTNWCKALRQTEVFFHLPKWETATPTIALKPILTEKMNLTIPFDKGTVPANFSNMDPNLYLGNVYHKAFIKVNEEGSEAAAVTSATMKARSAAFGYISINRPFIYIIKENSTNSILFMGQVCNFSEH